MFFRKAVVGSANHSQKIYAVMERQKAAKP